MRVAYVCADPGVPVYGAKGCSLHVQEVLRVFVQRGDEVILFAARVGGEAPSGLEPVRVHPITIPKGQGTAEREAALQQANAAFTSEISQAGPFDVVYERHALWAYAAAEHGARHKTPVIVEVNAPLVDEQATHRELIDRVSAEEATRRCFRSATVIACVSGQVADYARENGAPPQRVRVTPNGVRVDRFLPRTTQARDDKRFTIGFVGSLRPWHAVDDLLEAFALLKAHRPDDPSRLVILGDGPQGDTLRRQADAMPSETRKNVQFVGQTDPDYVPFWLDQFDVAVAPYSADDNCYFSPLKVFEYFAAGRAVLAARTGQLAELIDSGATGLFYEPGNPADLAQQLEALRDDPGLIGELGQAARAEAVAHHRWECRVEQLLETALGESLTSGGC